MFLNIDKKTSDSIAIIDDSGNEITYGQLKKAVESFMKLGLPRCIIFCFCENSAGALVGFLAFESNGQVPLMLGSDIAKDNLKSIDDAFKPCYYWVPEDSNFCGSKVFECFGYKLIKTNHIPYPINDKLSLLLPTSGSTGSPKVVRHKYGNLEYNAESVANTFGWNETDRGICSLPLNYTMGLNVVNSHFVAGASVILMKRNLMDSRFWEFVRQKAGTNFTGVPFSYDVIRRIGIEEMDIPALHTFAEGGGRLSDRMFKWIAMFCKSTGRKFYATYGTSETSARVSYLNPDMAEEKTGSIGKPIYGTELFLIDEETDESGSVLGELCVKGPNVTMGYAESAKDLLKGDEFCGEYHTGDIAVCDTDGFYYIIGRKKRFLKLYGIRIGLDETERMIKDKFECDVFCLGNDKYMDIQIDNVDLGDDIISFVSETTGIHKSMFRIIPVKEVERNEAGKVIMLV